jgi:hypothetical protein
MRTRQTVALQFSAFLVICYIVCGTQFLVDGWTVQNWISCAYQVFGWQCYFLRTTCSGCAMLVAVRSCTPAAYSKDWIESANPLEYH